MEIYTKDVELPKRTKTAKAYCQSVPIVFGAFGAVTKNLIMWVKLTAESLLVGNSKDLKRDPRQLRR